MKKKNCQYDNSFERNGTIVFAMLMIGNALGVIFQLISGRILNDVTLYADLNALLSLYTILIWPMAVITFIVTKYISQFNCCGDYSSIKYFIIKSIKPITLLSCLIFFTGLVFNSFFKKLLHINNSIMILLIIILASSAMFQPLINGSLQGMKKFFALGLMGLLGQIFKIIAILLTIGRRHKLEIILIILLFGAIITVILGFVILARYLTKTNSKVINIEIKSLIMYGFSAVIANLGLTLLSNVDMIVIKYFFDSEAGFYSVALILGKIVTYFSGAIVVVLFPFAVDAGDNRQKACLLLKKSLSYNIVLSIIAALLLNLLGKYLINLFYGSTYQRAGSYLFPVTILVLPISIITVIINFVLARDECKSILFIVSIGIVGEILSVCLIHDDIINSIYAMGVTLWGVLFICFYLLIKAYNNEICDNKK